MRTRVAPGAAVTPYGDAIGLAGRRKALSTPGRSAAPTMVLIPLRAASAHHLQSSRNVAASVS